MALLDVQNLSTYFKTEAGLVRAVEGLSFSLEAGERLAIVGESGCGKTVTALSIMRLLNDSRVIHPTGAIFFQSQDLLKASPSSLEHIRGQHIGMVFQEPATALNPVFSIAEQVSEPLIKHLRMTRKQAYQRSFELLERMGLRNPETLLKCYPHQLSGGMRQRVVLAMAVSCKPKLLIADEPTTALDVTLQAQILALLGELVRAENMALVLITHDIGIVRKTCERVLVLYGGQLVESGATTKVLDQPNHPYTTKLLRCLPRINMRGRALDMGPEAEQEAHTTTLQDAAATASQDDYDPKLHQVLLHAKEIKTWFPRRRGFFGSIKDYVCAVDGVSLEIREGTTLAVVGESGCGKSTLAQSLLRLLPEARGSVYFAGKNIFNLEAKALRNMRKSLQIVFQDPFGSLNPRLTVKQILAEGLSVHEPKLTEAEKDKRIKMSLGDVGLDSSFESRYPHAFSGGQRQRIALARALVLKPNFLILDEATSALDVSVQAQVLNLLRELQKKYGLTYLFVTHDIRVVSYMAHEIAVMYMGKIVEYGKATAVLRNPQHPYTQRLLGAVPVF